MPSDMRLRALVVDDDEIFRNLTTRLLSKYCDVDVADSGNTAIEFLKTRQVDIIFSDVCMANGSGIDLLNWVTSQKDARPPAVVLVTGQSTINAEEAKLRGAREVVSKPFRISTLTDLVKTLETELK